MRTHYRSLRNLAVQLFNNEWNDVKTLEERAQTPTNRVNACPFSSNQLFLIKYKSNVGLKSYYDCFAMFLFNLKFLVCVYVYVRVFVISLRELCKMLFKKGCFCCVSPRF